MKVSTFTKSGTKATAEVSLDKAVFGRTANPELLKLAYLRSLANARQDTAKTKTRGEISGGGKKPWRQKGTGRARTGSIRNPIWRGGGTIFGPTGEQNHAVDLPKKAIRASLAQAFSLKAEAKAIHIIEAFDAKDGKVKSTTQLMAKLGLDGPILLVVLQADKLIQRSTRNLVGISAQTYSQLSVNDILNAQSIVITKDALEALNQWLGGK